ncbi:16S rRNA (guanine(966)-N(2))-methyltransferase RsmD [Tenacibaculum maritimum]|uniref:Putative methyltransferase n=1 Tax=Tenacibaculum maritimum NCIMB 2154 TaxID=1349785 RepID=A0A2H1EAB0_9FLAO|nr:16S rRNA (guanine(966)-N(2))-methyltransferase RsmD [Tenacibaculum maritimum]MCD9561827.1 16S rRNA (guanine(966)-N(2))-methyltransferase RsmD [Tenacibaculum maritimum]MCD9566713.1 16S rRNA (guanine(966)-N(2))-methyltransferase RsmD [Tenacibaculum maritimum]MCD9578663.1 16S rRNA (guanine(966)-N(2))-methyltransferase RsmD [Tenacibaculum maritimum]MCD9581055.1 16S rRNA (guanine(966)-N(2))-methyltransferase RsmD [Tenacibaculum maritimum]MCD9585259.1 16S rRNA (guanine(966)-N(2))-methyltransferas
MRIISGKYKGRRLTAPKNLPVRPTTDMAKESLFNILNNLYYFDAISVMDLFSGTGNISFEFASRGSKEIYAVDQHFACIKFIQSIAENLNFDIHTYKSDVYKFLEKTPLKTDVIFADPPYDFEKEEFLKIVNTVFERNLLNDDGLLIVEHSKHTDLSSHPKHSYDKRYGGNVFSFFEKE